ncbi:retinol-binding protein pinta-like [Haematobia irritans]|uniref:retinol-binding protein pinta-like n=1 Tax=Haematobia irritans TaxID=7368 RepID=UPI003F4F778E
MMAQIQPLTPELQKIAIDELGEVPSRIEEDLQVLKTWIKLQPHLKARTSDQFLIQFLRGCKYSLERAKEKIDRFYAMSSKYPELLSARDVDNKIFRGIHNLGSSVPLPEPLNGGGPRIFIMRIDFPTQKYNIEQFFQPCNTMHELMLTNDPYACINGVIYIADFAKTTTSHFLQFTPSLGMRQISFYEKALPFRIKAWIFINVPPIADQFLKIVVSCLSEKLRKRLFIYSKNVDKLTDHIPLKYLPKEYGGENSSLEQIAKDYNNVWDENREYLKENIYYGTDESLRPGKPLDFDSIFGMCGSFRKLDVD